jgi:predicted PurR-regulated permease PerM
LVIGLLFIVPLGFILMQVSIEVQYLVHELTIAQKTGLTIPTWVEHFPFVGTSITSWWNQVLGTPGGVLDWIQQWDSAVLLHAAKTFSHQLLHRLVILGFTLITLFFLYRDGATIGKQMLKIGHQALGTKGERYAEHAVLTVRATINGLVLVGLGEGLLLGIAYAAVGLPSPTLWGAMTGFLAMIPFAAPVIFGGASLMLFAQGHVTAAILLFSWGALVLFIADHFIRPGLIGGSTKLPFLWVLLGILGGLETFGLIGLFIGPVVMSIAVTVWRDWTHDSTIK